MKRTLFVLLAATTLAGCTSTVSKNVRADGSVGELVWPSQKDSWRDEALRLPSPTIAAVKVGLERKNVFALLDVPHFSEINGAREWNYILQRPEYTRENQAVCHLKLIYGDDDRIAAQYWSPEDCATVYDSRTASPPTRSSPSTARRCAPKRMRRSPTSSPRCASMAIAVKCALTVTPTASARKRITAPCRRHGRRR